MTGHDYLLKWIKETYPLMDSADYAELDYYDMQKFAVWLVKLLTIPPVINCPNCGSNNTTNSGIKPYKHYCRECTEHWN